MILLPVLLLIHLVLLLNTQFTLWPEMVVYPYLLNNDFLLYRDIINPYPPALTVFLARFSNAFGYDPTPYQFLAWAIILITDLLVFTISKKITGKILLALSSTTFFIFFSIPLGVNGFWFDLIQTPFILASFYYFFKSLNSNNGKNLFLIFLFTSFAIFIKQQAVWLGLWYLIILIYKKGFNLKKNLTAIYSIFLTIIFISISHILWLNYQGTLNEFIFWVVKFPLFEALKAFGYILLPTVRQFLIVSILFLFFLPIFRYRKSTFKFIYLTSLILITFTYPRFDYFHLIPALSILSLSAGPLLEKILRSNFKIIVSSLLLFTVLVSFSLRYFKNYWGKEVRFFESEIYMVAKFMSITLPSDKPVYIQNGPDQLLPLSGRIPTKPWADEFPWYLEIKGIQDNIIKGIQNQDPQFIIFQPYTEGNVYRLGSYRPKKLVQYLDINYQNKFKITESLILKSKKEK